MTLERNITLPAPPATVGGLLAQSLPLPAGWERGVTFPTTGCLGPFTVGPCPTDPAVKDTSRPGVATFSPVEVGMAVECSTLSGPAGLVDAAAELDATIDFALAHELATGTASARDANPNGPAGNPALQTSVTESGGDVADPVTALACLEQRAVIGRYGRPVWIHASPAAATHLAAEGAIWRDGVRWRTAAGSNVLIASGYAGLAPVAGITTLPLYATGPVYAARGQRDVLTSYDRTVNTAETRAEDIAIVVFDPCYVGAVGTGLPMCVIA